MCFAEKSSGSSSVQTHQPPKVHGGLHLSVVPMADEVKTAVSPSSRITTPKDNISPASKRRYLLIFIFSFVCLVLILMFTTKIRKKGGGSIEHIPMERPNSESRNVVHTQTLFDIVNDGYRWRKYGQKSVKGSPYPRLVVIQLLTFFSFIYFSQSPHPHSQYFSV